MLPFQPCDRASSLSAKTAPAQRVKCFFRMCNIAATGLEFDPNGTYRGPWSARIPCPLSAPSAAKLRRYHSLPRSEWNGPGQAGATSMASQIFGPTYEIRDIAPNPSGAEVTVYFGCWLDINQTRKRIPINPGASDGPWPDATAAPFRSSPATSYVHRVRSVFRTRPNAARGNTRLKRQLIATQPCHSPFRQSGRYKFTYRDAHV